VLQSVNDGYFVNTANVYGNLASIKTFNSKTMLRSLSVNAASGTYDPNTGNNQASFNFNSINPFNPGDNGNNYNYDFPRDVQPPDDPKVHPTPPKPPEPQPPNHNPPNKPSQPLSRLEQDILSVRGAVSTGKQPEAGKLRYQPPSNINEILETFKKLYDIYAMLDDIATVAFIAGLIGGIAKFASEQHQIVQVLPAIILYTFVLIVVTLLIMVSYLFKPDD